MAVTVRQQPFVLTNRNAAVGIDLTPKKWT